MATLVTDTPNTPDSSTTAAVASPTASAAAGPKTFKQKLLVWIWNSINAIMGGAATAGGTVLTGAAVGAAAFTPRQIWSTVAAGAAIAFINYVRTNRLPAMFETGRE